MRALPRELYDSAGLEPWRDLFARFVRQGGPERAEYGLFQSWLERMAVGLNSGGVAAAEVQNLWAAGGPATASPRTMQGFVRSKPHGYAGDFEVVDRIYQAWVSPDPALEKWDRFFHAQAAPRAVRNTKAYFQMWLREAESSRHSLPSSLHLLHLGGGPGRELRDYFLANAESRVVAMYLDPDARAITYAAGVCLPVPARVRFHQASPLGFQPAAVPHLIWAGGVLDYLDDENGISLLRRLWRLMHPGGELVAGNFSPCNPTRAYMELNGWMLNYRNSRHLVSLAQEAGIPESAVRIGQEAEGVNQFLHLKKPDFTLAQRG